MTDLLTKPEPHDTGEIPRVDTGPQFDPDNPGTHAWDCYCDLCRERDTIGEATQRLNPMIATAPFPALRRSDATGEIPHYNVGGLINGGCRTVVPNDEDFVRPGQPVAPAPEPTPPPPPKPSGLGEYRERRSVLYVMPTDRILGKGGRHRRPRRFEPLWSALESGLACVLRAL